MLNIKKLLPLIFLFLGCGPDMYNQETVIDSNLQKYVTKFEEEIGVKVSRVDVVFADLDNKTAGLCMHGVIKSKIMIDIKYWNEIREAQREEILYHELGHCVLHLRHNTDTFANGCAKSIMFPYAFEFCYIANRDYYVNELKNAGL